MYGEMAACCTLVCAFVTLKWLLSAVFHLVSGEIITLCTLVWAFITLKWFLAGVFHLVDFEKTVSCTLVCASITRIFLCSGVCHQMSSDVFSAQTCTSTRHCCIAGLPYGLQYGFDDDVDGEAGGCPGWQVVYHNSAHIFVICRSLILYYENN